MRTARRRSPQWIRDLSSNELHALAHHFNHVRPTVDLSDRQEWLFDTLIMELEWRRRTFRPAWAACACMLCIPPFPDYHLVDDPF